MAFVLGSGEIRGVEWCISSRLFRGIEIVTIEHRYQVINNVGRPLVAHAVLLPAGKKVCLKPNRTYSATDDDVGDIETHRAIFEFTSGSIS